MVLVTLAPGSLLSTTATNFLISEILSEFVEPGTEFIVRPNAICPEVA